MAQEQDPTLIIHDDPGDTNDEFPMSQVQNVPLRGSSPKPQGYLVRPKVLQRKKRSQFLLYSKKTEESEN
jgi:hypothetical protein